MPTLTIAQGAASARTAHHWSREALDRPLPGNAELRVLSLSSEAVSVGAFQRAPAATESVRRSSGGPNLTVGPGTLHVVLALENPAALVPCDPKRLVNRYVRPLLRALTKAGALTSYFGRDWLSAQHRPVGQVGFAHDSQTGRAVFEAFVAVQHPFAEAGRGSFLGKEPGTLEGVFGRTFDVGRLAELVVEAYAALGQETRGSPPAENDAPGAVDVTPWLASRDEAIGQVAAGPDVHGALRLGGDLLASRDALRRIEGAVSGLGAGLTREAVGAIVDAAFANPGVALDGVRDLRNLQDVLFEAATASVPPQSTPDVTEPSPTALT